MWGGGGFADGYDVRLKRQRMMESNPYFAENHGKLNSKSSHMDKSSSTTSFWGWFFILVGSVLFFGFFFAAVISKLLPPTNNPIISAIQNDRYYCLLVPLSLPMVVVAVYFHWLSMKVFKHA